MSSLKKEIYLKNRMGKSPISGYLLWDMDTTSIELQAITRAGKSMRQILRLPKNPEDIAHVFAQVLAYVVGPLSAQAMLTELISTTTVVKED
jgi:hypothetical protein